LQVSGPEELQQEIEQSSHLPAALALVVTDVVGAGAAKRAAALGADASARDRSYLEGIHAKYQQLIRDATSAHNGSEIAAIGDSFFLAFDDPVDAIRCSAAMQQRLKAQPIDTPGGPMQLRIGVHVGTPEFSESGWQGAAVDTAARAESVASPGQVLVTNAAREAAGDLLGIRFTALGTFTLKDVGDIKLWDADYDQQGVRSAALRSNEQTARAGFFANSIVCILALAVLALGGSYLWRKGQQQSAASAVAAANDSIILADIENRTGDPVFDTTLTQAFEIQMQQSPVLNLVSQQHLRQSMRYLGKSPDEPLTPAIVREVGRREGVKAYLTGMPAQARTLRARRHWPWTGSTC
jgi:class 3 adenylate cyclase